MGLLAALGACVPSAVRTIPELGGTLAALHPAVPAGVGVDVFASDGQQEPPEQWLHRGTASGHLQPGR